MLLTRCGWITGLLAVAAAVMVAPSAPEAWRETLGPDFPDALLAVARLGLLAVAGWVLLVLAAELAHVRLPGVPRALRAALVVPVTVVAVAGPAHADRHHDVAGLSLPDRPVAASALMQHPADATRPVAARTVTVRSGDTLWSLAARDLPADASTARITQTWRAWYRTNRDVVGSDPDLILPGQVLIAPDLPATEQDAS